jgi:membrane protein required for colicin V production
VATLCAVLGLLLSFRIVRGKGRAMGLTDYLVAMPIAVWAMSLFSPEAGGRPGSPLTQNSLLFFGIFLITGIVLGKLMRMALDETIGPGAGIADRLAGAALGAVRVGLVAVTLVVIFDQLVPSDRQPAYLTGSQLRPLL